MAVLINVIWAFVSVLLFPNFISDTTLGFSNSVFSILMFVVIYIVLKQECKKDTNKRLRICTHVLGFLFAFMIGSGYSLEIYGAVAYIDIFGSIVVFTHVFAAILSLFWQWLISFENVLNKGEEQKGVVGKICKIMDWELEHPYVITLFLLACWTPLFIADFPGGFRYDATGELYQVFDGYNGNYPLLHSVIITRLLPFFYDLTGSYNTGVAVYVIIQMIITSIMYTHILCEFGKKGINRIVLAGAMLYIGGFPIIQILVVQEVRDVMFSILLTYTMFLFYMMVSNAKEFFQSIFKPIMLAVFFVLTIMARNNNAGTIMLIAIVVVSIIIWFVYRKKYMRGATVFSIACILFYWILGTWLTSLCQPISPASTGGGLSIMSQPIARAYFYEFDNWTQEEIDELGRYMNLRKLKYFPENADTTKSRIYENIDFVEFFNFWCRIGMKYPGLYVDAMLENTKDMWFPSGVVNGYNQSGIPYYQQYDKCYFGMLPDLEEPVTHYNLMPEYLNMYTQIGLYLSFEKIPVVSMLFSIGFQFWIVLNAFFYLIYRKCYRLLLPVGIILGYMIISAFVPLVLLRYFSAVFLAMPMVIVFTLQPQSKCLV